MGRFVGNSVLKPVGTAPEGYTKAEVFTTPGSTTWTVPSGVVSAKVFVIGAGSNYRATQMCFRGENTYSGVTTPICNYCLNFIGHLPGAGGGYAEKTLTALTAGTVMTINVGSVGGLSASSITIGSTTVTATNATETSISFNCSGHSTARDNSLDNPVSLGWSLPRCGTFSYISGYFNAGGTATGGDVNRSGGRGVFIPYFCQNSCLDYSTSGAPYNAPSGGGTRCMKGCTCWQCQNSGYDYSFGGTRYNCNCFVARYCAQNTCNGNCGGNLCMDAQCICLITYHNVFGGQCYYNMPWASCVCQRAWSDVTLCTSNPSSISLSSGTQQPKYLYAGQTVRDAVGAPGYDPNENYAATNTGSTIYTVPAGVGASSGRSAGNGLDATSETFAGEVSTVMDPTSTATASYATCFGNNALVCCICFGQDHFNFYFGSGISQYPWAGFCALGENLASATVNAGGRFKCVNMAFTRDQGSVTPTNLARIGLSSLKSNTGSNVTDFEFGYGAYLNAAGYGGGGNRLNPTGGGGAVIVIY